MSAVPDGRGGFLSDIETLRRRAREHIAQSAVTPGYHADRAVREDLVAEIAIDSYREIVEYLATGDITTRRLMEEILAKEEEHADDLASLLEDFSSRGKKS